MGLGWTTNLEKVNKHGRILASQYIPKQTPDGLWSLVSKHYTIKELNGDISEPVLGRVKGILSLTKGKEAEMKRSDEINISNSGNLKT